MSAVFSGMGFGKVICLTHVFNNIEQFDFSGVQLAHQLVVAIPIRGDGDGVVCRKVEDEAGVAFSQLTCVSFLEDGAEADAIEIIREGGGAIG